MSGARSFTRLADFTARASGRPMVCLTAFLSVLIWLLSGPLFGWSDAWQLVANTATNVITFLMVFIIQNSQNRDSAAIQAKLDELIRATPAHNELVGIEELTQEQIEIIKQKRRRLS